jgi:pyruvate dehydrogenase E2 component (dihydrolipoamide acetyltransferase)
VEDIFIPALGMAMEVASLVEWLKDPGDSIAAGDQVAIIETDKAMLELTAATNGVLGAHRFAEGDQVPAGRTVTVVLGPGESEDDFATAAAGPKGTPATVDGGSAGDVAVAGEAVGNGQDSSDGEMPGTPGPPTRLPHRLSPRQRRLAAEEAASAAGATAAAPAPADVNTSTGTTGAPGADAPAADRRLSPPARFAATHAATAPGGRSVPPAAPAATVGDRVASADRAGSSGTSAPERAGAEKVGQQGSARAAIARAVSRSWAEIPHFAVSREVRADGVTDRLAGEPPVGEATVSVTDVLIRAIGRALAVRGSSDVGLAVATGNGVVIPVIPSAADCTLADIAVLRRAAVNRARSRVATDDDLITPLMTLSNLGTHGVGWFTGIIPLGQQGLLTVGTLDQQPVIRAGRLAVGWRMTAILNVDHRTWDGADAAALLAAFASDVESYGRYADD